MKFSAIAFVTLFVALLSATEAKLRGENSGGNTVADTDRQLMMKDMKNMMEKKKKREAKREARIRAELDAILGNCKALENQMFEIETNYMVTPGTVVEYRCSKENLINPAVNPGLLKTVHNVIDMAGVAAGAGDNTQCSKLCEIEIKTKPDSFKPEGDLIDMLPNPNIFCAEVDGILWDPWDPSIGPYVGPCYCDERESPLPPNAAGCGVCAGDASVQVIKCYDSSPWIDIEKPKYNFGKEKPNALSGDKDDKDDKDNKEDKDDKEDKSGKSDDEDEDETEDETEDGTEVEDDTEGETEGDDIEA